MQEDKLKVKLNKPALIHFGELLQNMTEVRSAHKKDFVHKMFAACAMELYLKLLPKIAFPKKSNTVSFTHLQALVFYHMVAKMNSSDFATELQYATALDIKQKIHQKYI